MRSEVLAGVKTKSTLFWDVTVFILIKLLPASSKFYSECG
jgi:hypothetical protein